MAKCNLLWIEDDAVTIAALMKPLTEEAGCIVTNVRDFEAAKEIISKDQFDLIILDIIIPSGRKFSSSDEINATLKEEYFGIQFLKTLSSDSPPVIVVTVVNDPEIIEKIRKIPCVKDTFDKGGLLPSVLKKSVLKNLKPRPSSK
ncbi:MAG: response regulator [Methanoregula sp.]|jgi:CheY-like chemotaxis protein|nr:response regulator [Methanoregula sp.]